MEKILETFASYPSERDLSEDQLRKQSNLILVNYIYPVPASQLAKNLSDGRSLLDVLNPGFNTLPYVFVLCAKIDTAQHGTNVFDDNWRYFRSLMELYDTRQINYCQREFRRLVESFCQYAEGTSRAIIAVKPLKKALLRIDSSLFSFMHTIFTRICLKAKCYRDAIQVLDIDIFDAPQSRSAKDADLRGFELLSQEVMEYYLYGAQLYMGVKNWRRAQDFLSQAIAFPGNACSAIQVEAYKKYILVGLILDGKIHLLPKCVSPSTARGLKSLAKPYESFATAFKNADTENFRQEITLTRDVFSQDQNTGLAEQCIRAFQHMQIIALKETYVTLGVCDIARQDFNAEGAVGGIRDVERIILGMIERGEIDASLSQPASGSTDPQTTVQFDSKGVDEAHSLEALEQQIKRIVSLNNQVKAMDKKLTITHEYQTYRVNSVTGGQRVSGKSHPIDVEMLDMGYGGGGWGDDDVDETVMDYDEV
ncbi:hypothetical protein BZA77DRAFT_344695 [Pyronema omphalodes]|nr:hypothetical protein BZA77DRAFT_344695 [Pyronema omphalodes]